MLRAFDEAKADGVLTAGLHHGVLCQCDARGFRVRDVCEEHVAPLARAGSGFHVLHVEDFIRKVLIENARLLPPCSPAKPRSESCK